MNFYVKDFIKKSLDEDLGIVGDITTDSIFSESDTSEAEFNFRNEGIVCGIDFAEEVFKQIDENVEFIKLKKDGDFITKGECCAVVKGKTKTILKGERIALNIIQRLSAIATKTNLYVKAVEKYDTKIADTRKTTPLFRYFEKYAVKIGGGSNHRFGLFDAVMLKDNHIAACKSISEAVKRVRNKIPHTMKIEVEIENMEQAKEALEAGADIIMIDNLRGEKLKECVEYLKGKVITEASGNVNENNISEVASTGVDIISTGAIIYSAGIIDIGLDFK